MKYTSNLSCVDITNAIVGSGTCEESIYFAHYSAVHRLVWGFGDMLLAALSLVNLVVKEGPPSV